MELNSEKYNCLVVDDEPIARKIIKNYIQQIGLLQLEAECINALGAIDYLRNHDRTDIIFLDINMPNLSGLQMLKILQPKQPVIFTTAYAEHALESYDLNAVDYLLKPFSFERFTKAVYKAVNNIQKTGNAIAAITHEPKAPFFIKSGGSNFPVHLDDILYCEAKKNYTMVVLEDGKKLMPLVPLSKFETLLSDAGGTFVQIHRSYLVATKHISSVTPNSIKVGQYQLPIGIQFRERFFTTIGIKEEEPSEGDEI
ncbi:LytR/AlgR family response regulator transcription factor [Segetibacter sp. 3557_3]|uniref:LytR/AlgR family response regulator transcription factor n=1 Tax=Segetibacter sp. 3557_3 TaxID=2547429 RepID=UPI0014055567|nr:LytTR family DNA-binding domain-containing protein [Segetibacter sp. 3557_3]